MVTKRLARDGLNTMSLVLKNTPPAKIQTIVAEKQKINLFIFFQKSACNIGAMSVRIFLLLCKKCKRWESLQTFLASKCAFVHIIINPFIHFNL